MPNVTFRLTDGSTVTLEGDVGDSLMYVATQNDVSEIVAECGGYCNCATCHVYVDPAWLERLPPMSDHEDELLDGTVAERKPESRLSCQIELSEALDGLVVATPERQV
jgi:2Fe-2S ferredoxin